MFSVNNFSIASNTYQLDKFVVIKSSFPDWREGNHSGVVVVGGADVVGMG